MDDSKPSYLALGDSYSFGEGVRENERWPTQLAQKLDWQTPQIIATTGWTTSELIDGISISELDTSYDWISLLIGVNNQYRGQSIKSYQSDLEILANIMLPLVRHKSQQVFVISIPDYGITPFARDKNPQRISQELSQYNQINKNFAFQHGFQYCDITQLSLKAKQNKDYLVDDQLHPSGSMYKIWVDEILKTCLFS
ncbi:lysophospholipase L1-like esterase [Catalinimonas alkaloidigena]|uniref:SGNH/GDSL hydrolase family protein n=1 Tax=Catalinimonas alkaloidigena TaxID=1075417 RepID=UPI002405DFF7|nr:SGNH/GDSL hydrolase family protein [Catalinimonas alkaloidigena]MDF9797185.1 lysophospholipase L1-like esterase [Catalinimonas alkaloidigena]